MGMMKDRAMSWLAVPEICHYSTIEVIKAMRARMVAVVSAVLTVKAQVPFS